MPKVPSYQPQVNPIRMPAVRQSFNLPEAPKGVDYSGLARGVDRAMGAVQGLIDQQDEADAKAAYNQFSAGMQDILVGQDGVLTRQGQNAFGAHDDYATRSNGLKTKIGEGLNGRALAKFYEIADRDILASRDRVMVHQRDQIDKHFDAQDLLGIEQAQMRAQSDYDAGPAFQYQLDLIRAYATSVAKRKGLDVDAYVREQQEPVHLGVIKQYIEADKPEDAETYLSTAEFSNPTKRQAAVDAIEKGMTVKKGNLLGDTVWAELGTMSPAIMPNMATIYNRIDGDDTLNEEGKDVAKRRVQEQFQKWRMNKSAAEENFSNSVYAQIEKGVDANKIISGIKSAPLDAKSKSSLISLVEHERGITSGEGGGKEADLVMYNNYLNFQTEYLSRAAKGEKIDPSYAIGQSAALGKYTKQAMQFIQKTNKAEPQKVKIGITELNRRLTVMKEQNPEMAKVIDKLSPARKIWLEDALLDEVRDGQPVEKAVENTMKQFVTYQKGFFGGLNPTETPLYELAQMNDEQLSMQPPDIQARALLARNYGIYDASDEEVAMALQALNKPGVK